MALSSFTAGRKLRASELNAIVTAVNLLDAQEVGFAERVSNGTTTTTTEKTYLRLDSIPIINGYSYLAITTPLIIESSVAADLVQVVLRGDTTGAATTASTAFTLLAQPSKSASGAQNTAMLAYRFKASSTGNLSLLLSYLRSAGTGNVRVNALSTIPAQLSVFRMGLGLADTGVDL